jgi:hypothetical protein
MQGLPLRDAVAADRPVRDAALFGLHGAQVNVTDGRYVYMCAGPDPRNSPLYEYTLMPTHMRALFSVEELQEIELAAPFSFTKGCRLIKISGRPWTNPHGFGTQLFDLQADPAQSKPLSDPVVEARMLAHLTRLMRENDAPPEQFERLGL